MRAYLMCAPRDEFNLQQSQPSADSQRFIFCHNIFCSGRGCVQNTHTRLSGVLLQIAAQCCCRRRGVSKGDAKVFFFDHTLFYKVQQKRFSLLRLGNEHKTRRAGIEPMAEARSPAAFRRIFAFVIQVQESAVDEGVGSASVFIRYRKSGGLVGNQNVAVFINGAQLRPCGKK